jgi:hypothetical protein
MGFWGGLKEIMYRNRPHALEEMTQNTHLDILSITEKTVHWVASNMRKQANTCTPKHSGYFKDLI